MINNRSLKTGLCICRAVVFFKDPKTVILVAVGKACV